MKFKNIAALCKKTKYAMLYNHYANEGGEQWIEDARAMFRVTGLPRLDKNSLATLLDVEGKQLEVWHIDETNAKPDFFDISSSFEGERPIELYSTSIVIDGETWKPVMTSDGIRFIYNRYIAALLSEYETLDLYERKSEEGYLFIVAKEGFFVEMVIKPARVFGERFTKELHDMAYSVDMENESRQFGDDRKGTSFHQQILEVVRPFGAVEFKEGDAV